MSRSDVAPDTRVAVLSRSWGQAAGERASAVRSLAGALSRHACVDVLVAEPPGDPSADGAFERIGIGVPADGREWPGPRAGTLPASGRYGAVLVDEGDASAIALARALLRGARILVTGGPGATSLEQAPATTLDVGYHDARLQRAGVARGDASVLPVGLYVRVHPYAAERPHHELQGASGYVLVLSERSPARATAALPGGQVRWLLARFARERVVVVEDAVATVWRARAPVSRFGVHTRMDLWRLIAHARATVDLGPGRLFARECVESLRYGVPVVVPHGTVADALVEAGGGIGFSTTQTLLDGIAALGRPGAGERAGTRGKSAVDRWYGDPAEFVSRMAAALELPGDARAAGPTGPAVRGD